MYGLGEKAEEYDVDVYRGVYYPLQLDHLRNLFVQRKKDRPMA